MAKPSDYVFPRAFYFMFDLLLDEDEFQYLIEEVKKFAEKEKVEISCEDSLGILSVISTMLVMQKLDMKSVASLQKLVYNIGYRDNIFVSSVIH